MGRQSPEDPRSRTEWAEILCTYAICGQSSNAVPSNVEQLFPALAKLISGWPPVPSTTVRKAS